METIAQIAARHLGNLQQTAGLASAIIYQLSETVGLAILPPSKVQPAGSSAIITMNVGRAWWSR